MDRWIDGRTDNYIERVDEWLFDWLDGHTEAGTGTQTDS